MEGKLMNFKGFDKKALQQLRGLPEWDAEKYGENKARFAAGLREPGFALISQLAESMPQLSVDKRASVSPLHNDLRFAKAGTPRYKDHLLLTAWEGADRKTSPMIWLRLDGKSVGFASGLGFTPKMRETFRAYVGSKQGAELEKAIKKIEKKFPTLDVAGPALKKVPRPFDPEHPRAELLKLTSIQVRFSVPCSRDVESPTFATWCKKHVQALAPIHRILVDEISAKGTK